ncbi:MAG: hypothetical protein SCARUB_02348 [Candidatus Scalindua rubra]|uniref:Uncharacterized protein n=1 Tax=Candidatus Scalindua rubra TaxID=1872076 RepID=A0A1E3XAB2_9BACT|nr:MAG: hypothetical protein SCARUB_02348 [Candidatus Scalindua rubra]
MSTINYDNSDGGINVNINTGDGLRGVSRTDDDHKTGGDRVSGKSRAIKMLWFDNDGNSAVLTVTRTENSPDRFAIAGFAAIPQGFVELEWPEFTFNLNGWKRGAELHVQGPGTAAGSAIYSFKDGHGGNWKAEVIDSDEGTEHRITLTDPNGANSWLITYENVAPIVWAGLAALYCLGSAIVLSLITDCTEECGGKPKKVVVNVRFADSFPYLPVCGKECIC